MDKATPSDYWKYFIRIGVGDDGKEKVRCNGFNQKYIIGSKKYAISYLKCHIEKCSKSKCENVRKMIMEA